MVMYILPSALRQNLYNYLDQVLETGKALRIKRKGGVLKIVPEEKKDIFSRLRPHPDAILCDPEELVHMDWSSEWNDELP